MGDEPAARKQTSGFTCVGDVALCCASAAASGAAAKLYNAGNGNRYALNYVWDLLQRSKGSVCFLIRSEGMFTIRRLDTAAASRGLRHDPRDSIEQGLRRTLAW